MDKKENMGGKQGLYTRVPDETPPWTRHRVFTSRHGRREEEGD
jgi:hypothetical protein